jgi:ESAT-6 family protein
VVPRTPVPWGGSGCCQASAAKRCAAVQARAGEPSRAVRLCPTICVSLVDGCRARCSTCHRRTRAGPQRVSTRAGVEGAGHDKGLTFRESVCVVNRPDGQLTCTDGGRDSTRPDRRAVQRSDHGTPATAGGVRRLLLLVSLLVLFSGFVVLPGSSGVVVRLILVLSAVPDGGVSLTGFDAVPVELQVCGGMLRHISDEVRTQMRVLEREIDDLFADGWQGKAAEGFTQGWELWHSGATEVLEALTSMGHLLSVTGQDYQRVDDESADVVKQSGAGL